MLLAHSVDTYRNVCLWRLGRELTRRKYSGYLPLLLRAMSNKSRRGRYHVIAMCLRPSPIISFFASVSVPWILGHSRLRHLRLVLTLYIYTLVWVKILILEGEKRTTDASHPFPSRKVIYLGFPAELKGIEYPPCKRFQSKTSSSISPLFLMTFVNNSRRKS